MEISKLMESIETFNNSKQVNVTPVKNYRGNQYALDQFNWELQKRTYFRKIKNERLGIKTKETKQVTSIDEVQKQLYKNRFTKDWKKLDKTSKLQKISEYLRTLEGDYDTKKKIKTEIYRLFHKGKLNKQVEYDKHNMKILKIKI